MEQAIAYKLEYLDLLTKANEGRHLVKYTASIPERIHMVCDSIEKDLGIGQPKMMITIDEFGEKLVKRIKQVTSGEL